ncbi:MAG: nicotinamide-nucleotide adenylyltransferase [Candidatus Bathyarchaeota archaeon]|nr:nicotinamide-nucleotide adenylyltransferase [Candidatus Bathyarchaeota archaeon]
MINAGERNLRCEETTVVNRGLYVGRFQPFHLGHLDAIKNALKEVDELVIVIGSAQYSHNISNPFTAGERLVMIRRALLEAGLDLAKLWIVPVPDVHLHMLWVSAVEGYTPKFNVLYSNEPLTRRLFMEAGYEVKSLPLFERKVYMSTAVREKMLAGSSWTELVPKSVAEFIKEIDGVNRLRDLAQTDRIS